MEKQKMDKLIKVFRKITAISTAITTLFAIMGVLSLAFIGFEFEMIIFYLTMALIPRVSNFYAKKISKKSDIFQKNYYILFTIINLLPILLIAYGIIFGIYAVLF